MYFNLLLMILCRKCILNIENMNLVFKIASFNITTNASWVDYV